MSLRPAALGLLTCAVVLGGCGGGSATPAQEAKVRGYLRDVRQVDCTRARDTTRCEVQVRRSPVGVEAWHCEFTVRSGGGSDACWSDGGSRSHLRDPPR